VESEELCAVCSSKSKFLFSYVVKGEHPASLHECLSCSFTFVKNPHWLAASFSSELNDLDIGSVDRCLVLADFVQVLIQSMNNPNRRFLDWGGGYGLLARIMRDRGVDFISHDIYTRPLFVQPYQIEENDFFGLITMSEVALHLTDPVPIFADILKFTNTLVFTAVIAPDVIPNDWWYLMPDTGQHVAIYHKETLQALAHKLGVHLTSDGRYFHVLHRERLNLKSRLVIKFRAFAFGLVWLNTAVRFIKRGLGKSSSLTSGDQINMIANLPWKREKGTNRQY